LTLSRGDQAAAFASVSRVLRPGAPFLFTEAEIEEADDAGITKKATFFHEHRFRCCRTGSLSTLKEPALMAYPARHEPTPVDRVLPSAPGSPEHAEL
jgi:hypothetical protein